MRADQYLSQIRLLRRQIARKQADAAMWHSLAETLSVKTDGERVQSSGNQDKMADSLAKAIDCEREAEALVNTFVSRLKKVIWQIDHLEKRTHAILLNEYYVHDMSVQEIATEWNKSYRHINRVKGEALEEFEKKFLSKSKNN